MSALRSCAALSLLVAASLPLGGSLEAGRGPVRYDRPLNPYDRGVVERVRARAAARLDGPEWGKSLTDFKDRGGRPLDPNLQPLGVSASRYLLDLPFVDGTPLPVCRN